MQLYKGKIYSFKLVSGEELIAEVSDIEKDYILISKPITVTLTAQGPDTIPTMIAGDYNKNMQLRTSTLSMIAEVEQHIVDNYYKARELNKREENNEEKENASSM